MIVLCPKTGDGLSVPTSFRPVVADYKDENGRSPGMSFVYIDSATVACIIKDAEDSKDSVKWKEAIKKLDGVTLLAENWGIENDRPLTEKEKETFNQYAVDVSLSKGQAVVSLLKQGAPAITASFIEKAIEKRTPPIALEMSPVIVVNGEVLGGK